MGQILPSKDLNDDDLYILKCYNIMYVINPLFAIIIQSSFRYRVILYGNIFY